VTNPMLDAALLYAANGYCVFPGRIEGKQKKSYKSAEYSDGRKWGMTNNPDEIRADFADHLGRALIGVPTGSVNKLWVLDVDTREGGHAHNGKEALDALIAEHGPLPETLQARSPSKSLHYYWRLPEGIEIPKSQSKIGLGLDVCGEGAMVFAPPSIRGDGAYEWINDLAAMVEAPNWLVKLAQEAAKKASTTTPATTTIEPPLHPTNRAEIALVDQFKCVASAAPGERNDQLNKSAYLIGRLVGGGELPEQLAIDTLLKACEAFGTDDRAHDISTIQSGLKAGKADPDLTMARQNEITILQGSGMPPSTPSRTGIRAHRIDAATLHGKVVPDREWTVSELVPHRNVTLLYGDGGVGKSLLALQLAAAARTNTFFFGRSVKQGPVEFITAEDDHDELHRRMDDIAKSMNKTFGDLKGLHVTSLTEEDALLGLAKDAGVLEETALYKELDEVMGESKPVVAVLDTLADVYGGNESIRHQVRKFIALMRKLALKHSCAVVLLAHPSLTGLNSGTGTSGSTAWSNSVRSRLYFSRVIGEDGSEDDPDKRVLSTKKLNYGRTGTEIQMWWRNGVFTSGWSREEQPLSPLEQEQRAERVFLQRLDWHRKNNDRVSMSTHSSKYAPKLFRREAERQGVKKHEMVDAMTRLLERGEIENVMYGAPSDKTFELIRAFKAPPIVPDHPPPPCPVQIVS